MRTPITLQEFLFTLNQDEDILVTIIDYDSGNKLINKCWKSDLTEDSYPSDNRYTYFDVEYVFGQTSLAKDAQTTVTITVTLIKPVVTTDQNATIDVTITATPQG